MSHSFLSLTMVSRALGLFLCFGLCASAPADQKIVGGVATTIEEVPYQLELQARTTLLWSFRCGAVIIGDTHVLTAGHCALGLYTNEIRVLSGATERGKGTIHTVQVATVHPDYHTNQGTAVNDVAYLKVTPPFNLTSPTSQAIKLTNSEPSAGEAGLVSGWGDTLETITKITSIIRKVEVPIISREDCKADYGSDLVDESMICAGLEEGGKDHCNGDSGGPLVVNGTLVGLVSWARGCAIAGYPGVYANVNAFKSWINEQVEANK